MSLVHDEKVERPWYLRVGDTLHILFNHTEICSTPITRAMSVNRVMIYDGADPEFFKDGYRVEFGESL